MKRFIAIAGNIGVGKSTLTRLLERRLGWEPFYEAVDDNPYLADFYQDMPRWAFHSQVFFLARRLQHHRQILEHPASVIQDRSVYEDAEVFARNLHEQGAISPRDYDVYRELYQAVAAVLPPPDLLVYLRAEVATLERRIALRGRDFEQAISREYLERLNRLYDQWVSSFTLCPVLTIPTDEMDFVANPGQLYAIGGLILDRLQSVS
ncbi:MAG TPA: deoxynucleoside kinase [Ardenticatenaceae bacterium]|nr:deoxynucleoside kinase [Ardenticatenaceae bacterium]